MGYVSAQYIKEGTISQESKCKIGQWGIQNIEPTKYPEKREKKN